MRTNVETLHIVKFAQGRALAISPIGEGGAGPCAHLKATAFLALAEGGHLRTHGNNITNSLSYESGLSAILNQKTGLSMGLSACGFNWSGMRWQVISRI